ncbi:MAG: SDR family oxidoreductase [Armatimonadetes bacterium]|nr:SDR family oxidoreductase [Armatimonadota bacterium]
MSEMRGKRAVVTGGSKGIGRAVGQRLAQEGVAVWLVSRTMEGALPEGCQGFACDVADFEAVREMAAQIGPIDLLVNAAGVAGFESVMDSDPALWRRVIETNLIGAYHCAKVFLPGMLTKRSGHILNIGSVASYTAFPGATAYCASKAGLLMFSRSLAMEVRGEGVKVSALLPGATDTPLWETTSSRPPKDEMMKPEHIAEAAMAILTQPEGSVIDELRVMPPLGVL